MTRIIESELKLTKYIRCRIISLCKIIDNSAFKSTGLPTHLSMLSQNQEKKEYRWFLLASMVEEMLLGELEKGFKANYSAFH